jgi:CHAT domain-containing protein
VIGEAADTACLFDRLEKEGGLVHLAAHAAQSYENHMFSQILLADGPVYSFDLLSRSIRSDLVVLSGCQTGDPGIYYDSDSLSLAQSFLMAGAKNVIASYWPVSDEVTCRFMDTFYGHLAHGALYPALRSAMADMNNRTGDIRLWAPFYLTCR